MRPGPKAHRHLLHPHRRALHPGCCHRAGRARAPAHGLRPLRGLRRARLLPGRPLLFAGGLRAHRRRARRHGGVRRRGAPHPRRVGRRGQRGGGVLLGRPAGVPPVHAPRQLPRHGRPGDPLVRRPRQGRGLAPRAGGHPHGPAAPRPHRRRLPHPAGTRPRPRNHGKAAAEPRTRAVMRLRMHGPPPRPSQARI